MARLEGVRSAVRGRMAEGDVIGAARLLSDAWSTVKADARDLGLGGLRSVSVEPADRFPLSTDVAVTLQYATDACGTNGT